MGKRDLPAAWPRAWRGKRASSQAPKGLWAAASQKWVWITRKTAGETKRWWTCGYYFRLKQIWGSEISPWQTAYNQKILNWDVKDLLQPVSHLPPCTFVAFASLNHTRALDLDIVHGGCSPSWVARCGSSVSTGGGCSITLFLQPKDHCTGSRKMQIIFSKWLYLDKSLLKGPLLHKTQGVILLNLDTWKPAIGHWGMLTWERQTTVSI